MNPRRLALLLCTALAAFAAADAASTPSPFPPDGRGVRVLELDVGARLAKARGAVSVGPGDQPLAAPPLAVPSQDACSAWCRAVGGCQLWSFCAEPNGCGGAEQQEKFPHGLCSAFSLSAAETASAAPPDGPLPPFASAPAGGSPVLAGFVQGVVPLSPTCAAANASAAQCESCSGGGWSESRVADCLLCAEKQAPGAASVRVAIGEGRGTGAAAEAASGCSLCAALGGDDSAGVATRRRCERCLQNGGAEGCGQCLAALPEALGGGSSAAERAAAASDRVAGCLDCVFAGGEGSGNEDDGSNAALSHACSQCASSRDPPRCYSCVQGAKAMFCRGGGGSGWGDGGEGSSQGPLNGSEKDGCIERREARVCRVCVEAQGGALAALCSAAAARQPFSPDVAACAAVAPPERSAGCYACAAAAAAKSAVGGCSDCSSLPGEMMMMRRRGRSLASPPTLLSPASTATASPALAPHNATSAGRRRATSSVPPFATTGSPAADCAACVADPSLAGDEAREWCFSCATRHRDDAQARAACFACLRRPLEELVAEEAEAGGRRRRGRGGAPPGYGDLCA
jgi:hypothetical protein